MGCVPQHTGNTGQCLQVVRSRRFRRKQQKNQIDRLIIDCIEIDGGLKPGKTTIELLQIRQFSMRDRDPATDARCAQPFPLQQDIQNGPFRKARCR